MSFVLSCFTLVESASKSFLSFLSFERWKRFLFSNFFNLCDQNFFLALRMTAIGKILWHCFQKKSLQKDNHLLPSFLSFFGHFLRHSFSHLLVLCMSFLASFLEFIPYNKYIIAWRHRLKPISHCLKSFLKTHISLLDVTA